MFFRHRILFQFLNWALLGLLSLLTGCRSEPAPVTDPGYDYFPLETGRYVTYDVDEQRYALGMVPVWRTYQIRETTGERYTDVTGKPAYQLLRHRRSTDDQSWQPDSVWSARLLADEAVRTENGRDFVSFRFPIDDQLRWNGNRYNTLGPELYTVRNSNQPFRVSDKQFGETVTVVARNDSTLLTQDKRVTVYARHVGIVYRERTQLQFCSSEPVCIGAYRIDYGIRQIYRLRAYGRN